MNGIVSIPLFRNRRNSGLFVTDRIAAIFACLSAGKLRTEISSISSRPSQATWNSGGSVIWVKYVYSRSRSERVFVMHISVHRSDVVGSTTSFNLFMSHMVCSTVPIHFYNSRLQIWNLSRSVNPTELKMFLTDRSVSLKGLKLKAQLVEK